MGKGRMVSSDTFTDEFFCDLTMTERLLWIGLITQCADDQGRLQDRPNIINSRIFPDDSLSVDVINAGLDKFVANKKIIRYIVDNKKIIQIVKWWDHQSPNWASPSIYPAPQGWIDRIRVHVTGSVKVRVENWDSKGGFTDVANQVSNQVANPVCMPIEEMMLRRNEKRGEEDKNTPSKPSPTPSPNFSDSRPVIDTNYMQIWVKTTGQSGIPQGDTSKVINAIDILRPRFKTEDELIGYLKPYYAHWLSKKTKDGRPFSKANGAWLYDWAVAGEPLPGDKKPRERPDPNCPICNGLGVLAYNTKDIHDPKFGNMKKCECVKVREEEYADV